MLKTNMIYIVCASSPSFPRVIVRESYKRVPGDVVFEIVVSRKEPFLVFSNTWSWCKCAFGYLQVKNGYDRQALQYISNAVLNKCEKR